ncbi:unnamed protein product [Sympodiomycopsis kandeliae]
MMSLSSGSDAIKSAWSQALTTLSLDYTSPSSCQSHLEIGKDLSILKTHLLTHHHDGPSSSGSQARSIFQKLARSVSKVELQSSVISAIEQRISSQLKYKFQCEVANGDGTMNLKGLTNGILQDIRQIRHMIASLSGDFNDGAISDVEFDATCMSKVFEAFQSCDETLIAIRDWVSRNFLEWDCDDGSSEAVRDNLHSLGLSDLLCLATERATRLHLEIKLRTLLRRPLDTVYQSFDQVNIGEGDAAVDSALTSDSEYRVGLDASIRPLLQDFIGTRLLKSFTFWTKDSLPSTWMQDKLELERWLGRFTYYADTLLVQERAEEFFDLIKHWPESIAAVSDLKNAVDKTGETLYVASQLGESLEKRLLHPGAKTNSILRLYVSLVYAVRFVDPSGILLSRVSGPIRKYLRGRPDTVPVIVASLLGDDEGFDQLREELAAAGKDESAQNEADTSLLGGAERDEEEDHQQGGAERLAKKTADHLSSMRPVDFTDPHWEPRPVDAGPSYRQSKTADVIAMLVSIFDDKQSFVKALEISTAKALLKTNAYDVTREYRNNEVLKRRFGDSSLARCDVMLQDIAESRRIDASIRQTLVTPSHSIPHSTRRKLGLALRTKDTSAFGALKPLVTSRQFWPDLEGSEIPMVASGAAVGSRQPATLASIGPPPGGLDMKLPGELGEALDRYNRGFTAVRDSRRLRWLPGYGRIRVQVEMNDGRAWSEVVDPVKASVLWAAGRSSSPESPLSKAALAEEMELSVSSKELTGAFNFWCTKNVLVEVEGRAGWFIECYMPSEP